MSHKAVIFDLDDTLLKTAVAKWAHHKAVAKQFYGIDLTDDVLAEHWGKPFEAMLALLYQNADTPENMLKANLSLRDSYPKMPQEDGVAIVKALIEANIEVGVITSTLTHMAADDLQRNSFPVERFFILQGADASLTHKPDPRVFDPALEILRGKGIALHETVYIGDALMDYYAARDAGIDFMGVATGTVSKEQFKAEGAEAVLSLAALMAHMDITFTAK